MILEEGKLKESGSWCSNFAGVCDYCGEKFIRSKTSIIAGRKVFQKDSCGNKKCVQAKREESQLALYGVKNVGGSEDSLQKSRATFVRKYGNENPKQPSDVALYFRNQGCELLEEYKNNRIKMKYRCSCGEYSYISWKNFVKGSRCGHCTKYGLKKKKNIAEIREIFRQRGCEFLDNDFRGMHYKHRYRCKCGNETFITFSAFYHQKQHCKQCAINMHKGEKHHNWKLDRVQHRLNQLFRKKCYSYLRHTLQATGKVKVGRTTDMLGYGPKELQDHIVNHPDWERVKDKNWTIDHIFPIAAFIQNKIYDIALINSLDNLRPMEFIPNLIKSDKYNTKEFKEWLDSPKLRAGSPYGKAAATLSTTGQPL